MKESLLNQDERMQTGHTQTTPNPNDFLLINAAREGDVDLVKKLLADGVNINFQDERGATALFYASLEGKTEVVAQLLEAKANVDLAGDDNGIIGVTALMIASQNGYSDVVKKLLDAKANVDLAREDGVTALMLASANGYPEVVTQLLKKGADVNLATKYQARTNYGETALILASEYGHLEIVKQLVKAGAEIDKTNSSGETALFGACVQGNKEIAQTLITAGAEVNQADHGWETPIFKACKYNNHEIVRTLIDNKATLKIINISGDSPMRVACDRGSYKCAIILIQNGADTKSLSVFEKAILNVGNFFSNTKKRDQPSFEKSAREQEEQGPMGAATHPPMSKKEEVADKISSWFLSISEAELKSGSTLTPSSHFGTSPVASGNIEAQNIQDPSLVASNAPSPLTKQAPLEATSSNAGTSPSTSSKKSEVIASTTQTRY